MRQKYKTIGETVKRTTGRNRVTNDNELLNNETL